MSKAIKIFLSILFFLCLANMPYGYYQFVRLSSFVGFGFLAYQSKLNNSEWEAVIYGGLALLFQPFFKIPLGREIWNIIDLIVGVGLIGSLIMNRMSSSQD